MPTYEYACEACGHRYEKREGFDAPARQRCPRCRKAAQRVLFAPPIVFKGSGFYKTDSRGADTSSGDGATPAATPAAASADSKTTGGGDGDAAKAPVSKPASPAVTTGEAAAAG